MNQPNEPIAKIVRHVLNFVGKIRTQPIQEFPKKLTCHFFYRPHTIRPAIPEVAGLVGEKEERRKKKYVVCFFALLGPDS
jgi:hypothetical protein